LNAPDLLQQDGYHAFLYPSALEDVLAYMFVFHDDVVKLAACRDLECRAFPVILRLGSRLLMSSFTWACSSSTAA
jgi:hypothetical protein